MSPDHVSPTCKPVETNIKSQLKNKNKNTTSICFTFPQQIENNFFSALIFIWINISYFSKESEDLIKQNNEINFKFQVFSKTVLAIPLKEIPLYM